MLADLICYANIGQTRQQTQMRKTSEDLEMYVLLIADLKSKLKLSFADMSVSVLRWPDPSFCCYIWISSEKYGLGFFELVLWHCSPLTFLQHTVEASRAGMRMIQIQILLLSFNIISEMHCRTKLRCILASTKHLDKYPKGI